MFKKILFSLLPLCIALASCDEKESNIGVNLQDPATIYDGIVDTAYCNAFTFLRDSLITNGQSFTLLGNYSDPFFGTSEAVFYSSITTTDNNGVSFDTNCSIDSVILSLYVTSFYPTDTQVTSADMHFEVMQLQDALDDSATYYSVDEVPVSSTSFYNDVLTIQRGDTMIADMKLNNNFISLIDGKSFQTGSDFVNAIKGVRIRLINDGIPVMATINLAASATRVTVYYRYADTLQRTTEFVIGHAAKHFTHFSNNYANTLAVFNNGSADSINGSRYLYLCPMGGTNIKLNINSFIDTFSTRHPFAVIHHAELLLPVADIAPTDRPNSIGAWKNDSTSISDIIWGYDGKYDAEQGYYRIRVTQHLQEMIRNGRDDGTLLTLYSQLTSPEHIIFNGYDMTATSGNAVRIRFVYTE